MQGQGVDWVDDRDATTPPWVGGGKTAPAFVKGHYSDPYCLKTTSSFFVPSCVHSTKFQVMNLKTPSMDFKKAIFSWFS